MIMSLSTVSRCLIVLWLTLIELHYTKISFTLLLQQGQNLNLETEGKINLLVTFIQQFVTQDKLSLIFTNFHAIFPHKTPHFSNNSHDPLKNAHDSKFHIAKLNTWKLTFQKQPIISGDEIKVNVILATNYKVKAKNFIIPVFYFPVSVLLYIVCCNTSAFSFFILISFLFEDFFKASKKQVTINKWYIKFDILVSRTYSAASNSKETSGRKINSIFPQIEPSQLP